MHTMHIFLFIAMSALGVQAQQPADVKKLDHVGITNRGSIAPVYFADLVLIDPATVKDNASIQNPKALSDGILKMWVNGVLVYKDKTGLQQYPGEFLGK